MSQPPIIEGGHRFLGHFEAFTNHPLSLLKQIARHDAPVTRLQLGPLWLYVVSHPTALTELLQQKHRIYQKDKQFRRILETGVAPNLLTTEADAWRVRRRAMQPAFHRQHLEQWAHVITEEGQTLLQKWAHQSDPIELESVMMQLSMRIIGRTLFGVAWDETAVTLHHAYDKVGPYLVKQLSSIIQLPLFIPTPANRTYKHALNTAYSHLTQVVQQRLAHPQNQTDLLDLLLAYNNSLPDVLSEISAIVFAGYETTALTMTWVWWLLCQHPKALQQVQEEVNTVCGNRPPTLTDLPHLPYTSWVVREALRHYPPAITSMREATAVDTLANATIPQGSRLLINIYGVHHHPTYWEKPDAFYPPHFADESVRPRLAFLPFLSGPRKCIGEQLALTEAHLITAMIAQQYTLKVIKPPIATPKFMLRTQDGFWVQPQARN